MQDDGLVLHRLLQDVYCQKEFAKLIEWDGVHRVPIKSKDVTAIVEQIIAVAEEADVCIFVPGASSYGRL